MRRSIVLVSVAWLTLQGSVARAEEDRRTSERVLGGVISDLLGAPQSTPDAAYTAKEQERLASFLQSGEYVTSRQGEPVDVMVFGVPLTHVDHVYTAKPIRPSRVPSDSSSASTP